MITKERRIFCVCIQVYRVRNLTRNTRFTCSVQVSHRAYPAARTSRGLFVRTHPETTRVGHFYKKYSQATFCRFRIAGSIVFSSLLVPSTIRTWHITSDDAKESLHAIECWRKLCLCLTFRLTLVRKTRRKISEHLACISACETEETKKTKTPLYRFVMRAKSSSNTADSRPVRAF